MRKILSLAWTDIRIFFSERSTLVFFLILPIVFTAVIGSANLSGSRDESGDTRFVVLLVDEDRSALSQTLTGMLSASDVIRPQIETRVDADRLFADEASPALLTIPTGFGEKLLSGEAIQLDLLTAPSDNRVFAIERAVDAASSRIGNAVSSALISAQEAQQLRPFGSDAERRAYVEEGLAMSLELLNNPTARVDITQADKERVIIPGSFEQASTGQLVTWTLITLLGASEVFVGERLSGTLRRLLTTPTGKASIITGKVVGRLAMGLLQMAVLIGAGALVFGVNWGRSPLALIVMVLAFGLAAVGLGVMLGSFVRTLEQASGLATMLSMSLAALGGAWWPLEVTPQIYQSAVQVLPTTWAMRGFNDVIVRGQDVAGILPEAGILLGFAVVFFVIGIRRLKFE